MEVAWGLVAVPAVDDVEIEVVDAVAAGAEQVVAGDSPELRV